MSIVYELLIFQNLLQVYHWQTRDYSHHIVVGNLYNRFIELTDKFVETYQNNKKILNLNKKSIPLYNMNDKKIYKLLENMKQSLESLNLGKRGDLKNIRDEMIMEINRGLYLLGMD